MQVGVTLRNMGAESTAATMGECVHAAESAGFESVWITDHVAIPPDDAVGSGGRYVDPLVTLGWFAGITNRIKLATGVIVLPYRAPLLLARQIAALQELSAGRMLFGVGVGWMAAEFRALGVERSARARITDASLELFNRCFAADIVEAHGQQFLFLPRPSKPPVLVGGRAPHALERAARFGDGWLPMGLAAADVARQRSQYREFTEALGRPPGSISVLAALPWQDAARLADAVAAYAAAGVDRIVCALRYTSVDEYRRALDALASVL